MKARSAIDRPGKRERIQDSFPFCGRFSGICVAGACGCRFFYNLTNGAQRKKSEKMTAFTTAYDNVILLDNTGGVYTFDYADYTEETDHTVGPDAAGVDRSAGNIGDVWIVDVRVWNAKAP